MCTSFFVTVLSFMQAVGDGTAQRPRDNVQAVLELASKESDLVRASSIIWSNLSDESAIRAALLTSVDPDERSIYILFRGALGFSFRVPSEKSFAMAANRRRS